MAFRCFVVFFCFFLELALHIDTKAVTDLGLVAFAARLETLV